MKKYEFTDKTIIVFGRTLYRIRALKDFWDVREGDLGGFVECEENLAQDGNAWVCGDAQVYDNARVYGNDNIFWISNIGSRAGTTTFFACQDKTIRVSCGCFFGDLEEFDAEVRQTHGDSRHGNVYRTAIEMAKAHIVIPEEEP